MLPSNIRQWTSLAILAIGLVSMCPLRASAQQSAVVCLSDFAWMNNSIGQNPCLVAAFVLGACTGTQFIIPSLDPGFTYGGPSVSGATPCECNTITYNLIAACSICQNRIYIAWTSWSTNCSMTYPGVYPENIPSGTAIPHWAYQDVTKTDVFNATIAQLAGDAPESTAIKPQATSTMVTSTIPPTSITLVGNTGTQSPTPTPTPTPTPSPSSSSNPKTWTIVRGAVGGIVMLGAIATWFYIRRRRQTKAPPGGTMSTTTSPSTHPATHLKLYDPSDPSTFPPSSPTMYTASYQNNSIHSNIHAAQGGHPITYRGAPEL
ncbi:hypothetical protein SCLCIDRAFT_1213929 [Scleroderma citrinum Foug A]|uniref:Transmembrane protein n=1 Tax=Scleroderma citrinum Foug A TaxID=1036808 RepID=A0A0C3E5P4_9AGAM|nr:hypothetical protein SCLCIDRAFT_1213929 [Scleroderma citrinum Foug A]